MYFFPRKDGDTVGEVLGRVSVASEPPATIRVAMARWRKERTAIVERLCELRSAGADVRVITRQASRSPTSSVDPEVVDSLRGCDVVVRELPKSKSNLHSKYFLVQGFYEPEDGRAAWRSIVWTGSANFTHDALRANDEAMLQIEDSALYDRYLQNFRELEREWKSLH